METSILNKENLKRVSSSEPEWLKKQREDAWEHFVASAIPTIKDEEFRQTDLNRLDLKKFYLNGEHSEHLDLLPEHMQIQGDQGRLYEGGVLVMESESSLHYALSSELSAQGVILSPLSQAIKNYPEIVKDYLGKISNTEPWKLLYLRDALWRGGMFLYVPDGIKLTDPIRSIYISSGNAEAQFPHTLVIMGEGSEATVIEEIVGNEEAEQLVVPKVELVLQEGSSLRYSYIQKLGAKSWCFLEQSARVETNASLKSLSIFLGGGVTKGDIGSRLVGRGASSLMLGLAFGDGTEHFDFHTFQDHIMSDTVSDLLFKTALRGKSSSIYKGLVRIERNAQRSNAYQSNRNILLSETARVDSQPKLEIVADDVRCTHGATVGSVDQDQLFYLQSRGINKEAAESLIVTGFFEDVIDRFDGGALKPWIMRDLVKKFKE